MIQKAMNHVPKGFDNYYWFFFVLFFLGE